MTKELLDTRHIKKFLTKIKREYPQKVDRVISRYNNNLAFETKKNIPKSLNQTMNIKSKKGENFLNRGVYVQKTKPKNNMGATVGSLKFKQGRRTEYSKQILERAFFGDKIRQFNSAGFFRKQVYLGFKKLSKNMFKKNQMGYMIKKTGKISKNQQFLISLRLAKKNRKKFLNTGHEILKIKAKSLDYITSIHNENEIKSKKIDWLTPAVNQSLRNKNKIFVQSMKYEIKKK